MPPIYECTQVFVNNSKQHMKKWVRFALRWVWEAGRRRGFSIKVKIKRGKRPFLNAQQCGAVLSNHFQLPCVEVGCGVVMLL